MTRSPAPAIAVVGAGVAGCRAAQRLAAAGCAVTVFDKARGPGGRLATRQQRWRDAQGHTRITAFDHGAPGLAANGGPDFLRDFVQPGLDEGWLMRWTPRMREGDASPLRDLLPLTPQPLACQSLLGGVRQAYGQTVKPLAGGGRAWQLQVAESDATAGPFDAVLLALPPVQASALLAPVAPDWARQAALVSMQPCWTLMAVTDTPTCAPRWDEAAPSLHPRIARVHRQDARPGREPMPGETHWVLHATPAWSRSHLEDAPDAVREALQGALQELLGEPLAWRLAVVHRWRFAHAPAPQAAPHAPAWWRSELGLGLAGDWLGGGGIPGAWRSGHALANACLATWATPFPHPQRMEPA